MNSTTLGTEILKLSNLAVFLGVNLFVQSTLLIATGLILTRLCRSNGAALQSLILRGTLLAVFSCPLASCLIGVAGIDRMSFQLPEVSLANSESAAPSEVSGCLDPGELPGGRQGDENGATRGPGDSLGKGSVADGLFSPGNPASPLGTAGWGGEQPGGPRARARPPGAR